MTKSIILIIVFVLSISFSQAQNIKELIMETPSHMDPVSVGAKIIEGKNGIKTVLLKANIMKGYHIYAFVPNGEAYINSEFGIEVSEGIKLVGDWKKSAPHAYPGKPSILIYKNENEYTHQLNFVGDIEKGITVKCWLYYQCCDANICFPPNKKEIELKL